METGAARAEYGAEHALERAWAPVSSPAAGAAPIARGALDRFQHVPVEVEAQLDRKTMTVRDILELDTGTIEPLGRSAGENIDILVGGALVAFGEIVVFEEVMGVRITAFNAGEGLAMTIFDSVYAALAVLALFGGAVWLLRRFGAITLTPGARSGAGRELVERERLALGPRERLHLVDAGGERLLVASHTGGVTLIARRGERAAARAGGGA